MVDEKTIQHIVGTIAAHPKDEHAKTIREWAAAYRLWNEQELVRRRAKAGQESVEEKLAVFFDLCEAKFQIAPSCNNCCACRPRLGAVCTSKPRWIVSSSSRCSKCGR